MTLRWEIIDFIEFLLLNLSFIFALFFIHQKGIERSKNYGNIKLLTLVSCISIVSCMTFSEEIVQGYILDMRLVPFIIGSLYGGRKNSFYLLIVLLSYRFYLGGDGFSVTILEYTCIFTLLWFLIPVFKIARKVKKKIFIAILAALTDAVSLIFMVMMDFFSNECTFVQLMFLIIMYLIQILGVALFVLFIEKAREENRILFEVNKLEKVKIVSELAASISHEVRNPLTVTRGFLQLLKDPEISQEKKLQYIDLSMVELDRAKAIISDYLTFARPSIENVELLNLNTELEYVANVLRPYGTLSNVNISIEYRSTSKVLGEKQKFHQCLINVIKNGIEAMPTGGVISITLQEIGENAVIAIQDNGTGMKQEQIDRLGTPYYSTKEKGTGLGTMVVFSIVQAMRGKVEVQSEINKGTRVSIILPKVT